MGGVGGDVLGCGGGKERCVGSVWESVWGE